MAEEWKVARSEALPWRRLLEVHPTAASGDAESYPESPRLPEWRDDPAVEQAGR